MLSIKVLEREKNSISRYFQEIKASTRPHLSLGLLEGTVVSSGKNNDTVLYVLTDDGWMVDVREL
jgi:hypothetical protein